MVERITTNVPSIEALQAEFYQTLELIDGLKYLLMETNRVNQVIKDQINAVMTVCVEMDKNKLPLPQALIRIKSSLEDLKMLAMSQGVSAEDITENKLKNYFFMVSSRTPITPDSKPN